MRTDSPRFESLEFSRTPWTSRLWSFALHAGVALVLIAIPVTVRRAIQPHDRIAAIGLFVPLAPVVAPHSPHAKSLARPVTAPAVTRPPAVEPVRRAEFLAPPPPKPLQAKTVMLPPAPVEIPKPIENAHLETLKIDLPLRPLIRQEVFPADNAAASSMPVPGRSTVKSITTGGFGDPDGVPAASGFGANGHAQVRNAGFGEYDAAPRAAQAVRIAAPVETPVEITFKPKPLYSPEAREKRIEGEVELEVLFSSTGRIRVVRLIRGLGFGLDENAREAASRIRFHPGTRNGSPVDLTGTVHIVFELS